MLTDLNAVEIGEKTEKGLVKIRAQESPVLVGGRGGWMNEDVRDVRMKLTRILWGSWHKSFHVPHSLFAGN